MIWGPYKADRPKFYTSWIDFCEKYNPGMKYFLMDAWPTLGQVHDQFRRRGNPESEQFFTDEVLDQLNAAANQKFEAIVTTIEETHDTRVPRAMASWGEKNLGLQPKRPTRGRLRRAILGGRRMRCHRTRGV